MASLIKNQVLKHLTKFFKDLAPEQLQLSAFKGSCELSNLQLEEKVLMDLLSFPSWVRINKAVCDQLSIKIPWTKIKSVPIQMNLNEVTVEVEVCEEFRDVESTCDQEELNQQIANLMINTQAPGKYGFVDRVIDGITVTVNNILIIFKSKLMSATFNLSRVLLESRCPNWKQGELSLTRIKEAKRGQILLFKVVDWQTMRLEAKCLTDPNQAPLRLITNHAQCRLTIKKSLEDGSVIAARIFVIFEDILWVLTFAQFISAASFVEYVFSLIKRSPVSKKTGLLQDSHSPSTGSSSQGSSTPTPNTSLSTSVPPPAASLISPRNTPLHSANSKPQSEGQPAPLLSGNLSSASLLEQKFLCYDLVETSLHLYIDKVDAHLYDDIESSRDSGGALQTTLDQIQVDCYPYSRANSDRRHWYKWFDPSPGSRKQWIRSHFAEFDLLKLRKFMQTEEQHNQHHYDSSASQTSKGANASLLDLSGNNVMQHNKSGHSSLDLGRHHQYKTTPTAVDDQLLSLTVLVKVKEYCMNCVATNHSIRGAGLNRFIQTDKDYQMPSEMPALYLELNNFYYFDAVNRMMVYENVPDPLVFMHLSPTKLLFDSPTLVFLNSFHVNLSKAFVHLNDLFPQETTAANIQCRIEVLMPQIILPAKKAQGDQAVVDAASTSSLLVKSGKITLCSSIYDKDVMSKLISSIDKLKENPSQPINIGGLSQGGSSNPGGRRDNSCTNDWTRVWNPSLISGIKHDDQASPASNNKLWAVQFEPIWMDFMNYDVDQLASGQRLEPIVEPVNAYAFVHLDLSSTFPQANSTCDDPNNSQQFNTTSAGLTNKRDVISILFTVLDGAILANMDKIQFGFLQRLGMHVERLIQQIKEDASSIIQMDTVVEDTLEINLTGYVKEIKARLILDKKINDVAISGNESSQTFMNRSSTSSAAHEQQAPHMNTGDSTRTTSTSSGFFSGSKSTVANPFGEFETKENDFMSCPAATYSPGQAEAALVLEGTELGPDEDLDECVEVADDASCMIFDESCSSKTQTTDQQQSSKNKQSAALNIDATGPTYVSDIPAASSRGSLPGDGGGSLRSVGKSPIEESFLINLDEIEQSSQLFAKVDLKPQKKEQLPVAPIELSQGPNPEAEKAIPSQPQQQDIETESISYLELSMSQLMVRRITETKRRQKF